MIIEDKKLNPVDIVTRLEFASDRTKALFTRGKIVHDKDEINEKIDKMMKIYLEQLEPTSYIARDKLFGESIFDRAELNRQTIRLQRRRDFLGKLNLKRNLRFQV